MKKCANEKEKQYIDEMIAYVQSEAEKRNLKHDRAFNLLTGGFMFVLLDYKGIITFENLVHHCYREYFRITKNRIQKDKLNETRV